MDPLTIIAGLTTIVPKIIEFIGGPKEQAIANAAVSAIKSFTGVGDVKEGVNLLNADPSKLAEFQIAMAEAMNAEWKAHADEMKARARVAESVNETMRNESSSKHWPQWFWRPAFGLGVVLILMAMTVPIPYLAYTDAPMAVKYMTALAGLSIFVGLITAPLGVIGYGRSQEKKAITQSKWGLNK